MRMQNRFLHRAVLLAVILIGAARRSNERAPGYEFNDSHFHLTNYIQQGTDIRDFLKIMGSATGRVALFGLPLQQLWSYRVDGDRAPKYYLDSDAPLYYYSFTDAWIATAYKSLPPEQQARFDPMITGFNPTDMYATDHIRRVLQLYPGVFSGIGEFSIHKEFVSSKIAGPVASLTDPALDRILDFAGEVGLVVLIHNDITRPFAKESDTAPPSNAEASAPIYLDPMKALFLRHPGTTIIWAHTGMGRVVRPVKDHVATLAAILIDPRFNHVNFDISWDEVAKYIVATAESTRIAADLFNRFPDRFLFGTDEVAPTDRSAYTKIYYQYGPLWKLLDPEACRKIRLTNYERIFDRARRNVRTWEAQHVK
jgi:hypothetical protein